MDYAEKLKLTRDIISIQQEQLAEWKTVLTDEAYQQLKTYAESRNEEHLKTGNAYYILRGNDLSCFLGNMAIRNYHKKPQDEKFGST